MAPTLERFDKIVTAIGVELALGTDANFEKLAGLAKDHAAALAELKGGYSAGEDLAAQVAEMKATLDSFGKQVNQISAMGLGVRGGEVRIPEGREARLQMLADGRAFLTDSMARRFGAWAISRMWNAEQMGDIPKMTREIADDVVKQWRSAQKDADVNYETGTGAELMSNEFRAELIRNVEAVGVIFPECRRVPLNTQGTTTYPTRTAGLTSYWVALGAAITRSGMTFGTVELTPKKVGTLTAIPGEMLRDPMLLVAIGQMLGVEITYAMADRLDNTIINADGTADHGGFTGILESSTIGTSAAASGNDTGAEIDEDDFDSVIADIPSTYALPNAKWYLSLSMLMRGRSLRTTAGDPIFDRGGEGFPANVDGYPFKVSSRMPAKSAVTAGLPWAIFGDLRKTMYVGMISNVRIDRSEHVYFAEDMVAWRGMMEVAIAEADDDAAVVAVAAGS